MWGLYADATFVYKPSLCTEYEQRYGETSSLYFQGPRISETAKERRNTDLEMNLVI
jgi:hypothetical protein